VSAATSPGVRGGAARGSWAAARSLLVAALAAVVVLPAGPASGAERVVTITAEGVLPSRLEVAPGDTVRFVSEDATFAYRAQSTGGPWSFDSGPTELLDGDYLVPAALVQPGTYTYRVAQDEPFSGAVVVPGPASSPAPAATPAPAGTSAPAGAAAPGAPEPSPTSGRAVAGPVPAAGTSRPLGLPVALATLLLLGTASLLVRLVLAEAARAGPALSDPSATLLPHGDRVPRW
jgi:plastocyanin